MSRKTYDKIWRDNMEAITYLLEDEKEDKAALKKMKPTDVALTSIHYYLQYLRIYQQLEDCFDQMVHPQKRRMLERTLQAVMGRMLEFKEDLVNRQHSEFLRFDEVALDLKLEPQALELRPPRYFRFDHEEELRRTAEKIKQVQVQQSTNYGSDNEKDYMSREEAIMLVQRHERARQGRRRFQIMKELAAKEREAAENLFDNLELEADGAAVTIQRMWRGAMARIMYQRKKLEEDEFLGMIPSPKPQREHDPVFMAEDRRQGFRQIQQKYRQEFEAEKERKKEDIIDREKPLWQEQIHNDAKQYVITHLSDREKPVFPEFPKTGSAEWSGVSYELDSDDSDYEEEKPKKRKKKKKKGEDGKKKEAKKPVRKSYSSFNKKKEPEPPKTPLNDSKFANLHKLDKGQKEFEDLWKEQDTDNFRQQADMAMYEKRVMPKLEKKVREEVDQVLIVELAAWKKMWKESQKGKKKKKKKKGSGNGTRRRSPRRRRGSTRQSSNSGASSSSQRRRRRRARQKLDLDIDPLETAEFQDLVAYDVIQDVGNLTMDQFVGDHRYIAHKQETEEPLVEPMPSMAELRRVVTETCIMPLGSKFVKENSTACKAVLFYGDEGCGKELMAKIVASSAGAIFINLSPRHLEGKFPGPLGAKHLMNLVKMITKSMQPVVVYVENFDHIFSKKRGKKDRIKYAAADKPTRLKKHFVALVKRIKATDRVLLIGTTHKPNLVNNRPLKSMFSRCLYFPKPDYSSRMLLWRHFIKQQLGEANLESGEPAPDRDLEYPSLARFSDLLSTGNIYECINSTLTGARRRQIHTNPLQTSELVSAIAKTSAVDTTEDLLKFRKKLKHSKDRVTAKEEEERLKEEMRKNRRRGRK